MAILKKDFLLNSYYQYLIKRTFFVFFGFQCKIYVLDFKNENLILA